MTVTIVILAVLAVWIVLIFNKLVGLKNQVKNAFRQIDVQLKRRHDLIPNLVNSVKGEMKFEQETLEKVVQARAAAVSAVQSGKIDDIMKNEGILSQALGRLLAISENYPNLKAEELTHTENQISFARQFYNDLVTRFNIAQQVFPNNVFASMMGFTAAQLFKLPENAEERKTPKVDLTI